MSVETCAVCDEMSHESEVSLEQQAGRPARMVSPSSGVKQQDTRKQS